MQVFFLSVLFFICSVAYMIQTNRAIIFFLIFSQEEMNGDEDGDPDEGRGGELISWGCGEFGQHCHGTKEDVPYSSGLLKDNLSSCVKFVACGASHTIVVTGRHQELSLLCPFELRERERERERERDREIAKHIFFCNYQYKLYNSQTHFCYMHRYIEYIYYTNICTSILNTNVI